MNNLEKTFTGTIEIEQGRNAARFIEAEITYTPPRLADHLPQFIAVHSDGESISLSSVTESSLIRAYAKSRGIRV